MRGGDLKELTRYEKLTKRTVPDFLPLTNTSALVDLRHDISSLTSILGVSLGEGFTEKGFVFKDVPEDISGQSDVLAPP